MLIHSVDLNVYRRCSFLLQVLRVTVIVFQVARFTVSSRLSACHSHGDCTSRTCLPALLLFFFSFTAGCQNNITVCHV